MIVLATAMALSAMPGAAQQEGREAGLIVRGEGRAEAAPDMATLTLGVTSEAGTAEEAMSRTSAAMTDVLDQLAAAGIAERDIQTSGLSLSPRTAPVEPEGAPRVSGYVAANTVTVRVDELSRLGEVLDAVVGEGANTLHGLQFGVAEPQPLEDAARRAAVADAMRTAEQMAQAADVTLGRVKLIAEEGGGGGPVMMAEARMATSAVPVAEGRITVERTVRMVFETGD